MTTHSPPEGWLCASCARFDNGTCPYFQSWTRHRAEPPPVEECSEYLPLPEPGKGPNKPPKGTTVPALLPANGSAGDPDPFPTDAPSSSNSTDSSDTVPTPKEA